MRLADDLGCLQAQRDTSDHPREVGSDVLKREYETQTVLSEVQDQHWSSDECGARRVQSTADLASCLLIVLTTRLAPSPAS